MALVLVPAGGIAGTKVQPCVAGLGAMAGLPFPAEASGSGAAANPTLKTAGLPASAATQKWWRQLRAWVADTAGRKITRWGNVAGPDADIWAFPSAYEKILAGAHRDANPSG